MFKKLLALLLALSLLGGCAQADLRRYPREEQENDPAGLEEETLRIAMPVDAPQLMWDTLDLLRAKIKELSDGRLKVTVRKAKYPIESYREGQADLYFFTTEEMIQMDDRLSFMTMPFLFPDADTMLTFLNDESGVVRNSTATQTRLRGEILGVYYGGTRAFLNRGRYYDEVGFYNNTAILPGHLGENAFIAAGAETLVVGEQEEIFNYLAQSTVKFGEYIPGTEVPPETLAQLRNVERTQHQFDGWWLVLSAGKSANLSTQSRAVFKEAFAYTVQWEKQLMEADQTSQLDQLQQQIQQLQASESSSSDTSERSSKITPASTYDNAKAAMLDYYKDNWQELGIPQDIWEALQNLIF